MHSIVLARHGRPEYPLVSANERLAFVEWFERHGLMGLKQSSAPRDTDRRLLERARVLVTSDVARAVESARRVNCPGDRMVSSLLREVDLSGRIGLGFKLRGRSWELLVRALWRLGVTPTAASPPTARVRAEAACQFLADLARTYQSVAVIGHGVMNRFIAERLLRLGWSGPVVPGRRYWECSEYRRADL